MITAMLAAAKEHRLTIAAVAIWFSFCAALIAFLPPPWASVVIAAFVVGSSVNHWRQQRTLGAVGAEFMRMFKHPGETDGQLAARIRCIVDDARREDCKSD